MSQANILIDLTNEMTLFQDQYGVGFVLLNHETIPLRSKKIRGYLSSLMWNEHRKASSNETLNQAINVLEARAAFDNPKVFLFNRVGKGPQGNDFYYDLGGGKAVRTTPQGWAVDNAPVLFRRYSHQKEQVAPTTGGDPQSLFEFINVESEYRLLILVYLISCLVPDISHPILHPYGDHGAGKTTACMMIKDLIDPSFAEKQSIQRDQKELIQTLAHHYFPLFDNVSVLSDWVSDVLSQACTGGGIAKRQLYTDDDDVIYQFKRPIVLNGINVVVHKADLMDRSILFPFERISPSRRKKEMDLWAEFERLKPSILGGIFDVLSKAMRIYPEVHLPWTPRMADFAAWGFAIAETLREGEGEKFLEAYRSNIGRQIEEVIESNALAQGVLSFMECRNDWRGTIGEAWSHFHAAAGEPKNDHSFPKNERTLRKALATIRPGLQHFGISYSIGGRTKDGYPIVFTKKNGKFGSFGSPSTETSMEINELPDERKGEAKTKKRGVGSPK